MERLHDRYRSADREPLGAVRQRAEVLRLRKSEMGLPHFDYDKDVDFALKKLGKTMDAFDPDLSKFRQRGGKLLLYHGWNDASISPLNTINYYESVVSTLQGQADSTGAEADAQKFVRLFMVPGMLHCGNGPGPNSFDMLTALENWSEKVKRRSA